MEQAFAVLGQTGSWRQLLQWKVSAFKESGQERLLVGEVPVHGATGHAGLARDIVKRGCSDTLAAENGFCRSQDVGEGTAHV